MVAMAVHRWDDEEILRALRHAFRARQAVPRVFVEAGRSAFAWRNVGVELAQLTDDSTLNLEPALSPRAEAAPARTLTYASAHLTIQLEVTPGLVAGQLLPDRGSVLTIQPRSGEESLVQASETGRFSIEPVPPGPFRMHCRTTSGINVITGWITL
jgi:hypothetical protein